ncbi:MAG: DUF1292 domain-containing protein [Bacilli bacterium]|nr:DUF1292 domain-containing protein [Bacilli bacterium]MCI9585143.1 DUF1292 domain-containing protein [Bacilli bacterium]
MSNRINVLNENGEEIEAEVLLYFSLDKTDKNYILYTFGEVDDNRMETIHASELIKTEDGYKLDMMPDDDWEAVKEVMREIIRNEQE